MRPSITQAINTNSIDYLSEATINIPYKDLFFISDLEKYYKYGKIPYILFTQLFLVMLTTSIIIIGIDDLALFRFHIRTMDTTFIPESADTDPMIVNKYTLLIQNIPELNKQIDLVLEKIFNFDNNFTHDIKLINLKNLNLDLYYYHSTRNQSTVHMEIKNKTDNPLKRLGENKKIRELISQVKTITIPIKYEMNVFNRNRKMKIIWTTKLIFNYMSRGTFKFETKHKMQFQKEEVSFLKYFQQVMVYEYGLLNALIIFLALFQVVIVLKRIYLGFQALTNIKKSLDRVTDDSKSDLADDDDNFYHSKGRTKWDLLQLNDKRKFFNLWYFIILIANIFQIMASINHLLFPILNETNQFLCAFSCLFTWFGCGYFLEYKDRYYFFYLTIEKSVKTLFKYLVVFILVFIGYGILLACTFNYSEKYYSNIHMAFITTFAGLVGDNLDDIWRSTLQIDPIKTIVFSFFYFLTFVTFLLRMLLTITEESFDCIKMRKSYYWLDGQLSLRDYIKHEINHKQINDNGEGENQGEDEFEGAQFNQSQHKHYMMSDAIMNVLLTIEQNENKIPKDLERVLKLRVEQMRDRGLQEEEISQVVKKELKRFVKKNDMEKDGNNKNSNNTLINDNNFFINDIDKFELSLGKTETVKMHYIYEVADNLIEDIENLFSKLDQLIKSQRGQRNCQINRKDFEEIIKRIICFTMNVLERLNYIKDLK